VLLPVSRSARTRAPRRPSGDAGVTFLELLVTMILAGVLMAVVAAPYAGYRLSQQHIGSARELVGFLRRAQVRSVAEETTYRVDFAADGKSATSYRLTAGTYVAQQTVRTMTSKVKFTSPSFAQETGGLGTSVFFYKRGSAGKGSVTVTRSGTSKTYTVNVEGLTARVSYS
jgi:prepilin-type N-terminal cleavage/methylation domain-containing protein